MTNFHLAPAPKMVDGLMAVPIDIQSIDGTLVFDGAAQTGEGDVTVTFTAGIVDGCPIFDLRQTVLEAWLDGATVPLAQVAHHDFGGGTDAQLRIVEQSIVAGTNHTLRVRYSLGIPQSSTAGSYQPHITWSAGPRLTFNFGFTDLGAGRYLEAWVPANLIFDQFGATIEFSVLNTAVAHSIITNATISVLGTNHWRAQWPAHSTALSTLVEIRATDSLQQLSTVVALPVSATSVTIEAWKLNASAVDLAVQSANIQNFLTSDENDIGSYPHGSRFVAFLNTGGMEYDGGTTSGTGPLQHETFHSWWGRGIKPASQPDGWWDEAWNEYNMAGGTGSVPLSFAAAPVTLSSRNAWSRVTPGAAYGSGRELFEGLAAMSTAAQLQTAMNEFFAERVLQLATTAELEAHVLSRIGQQDIVDAFHRFVYGFDDTSTPDLWFKDAPAHTGADAWSGTFWNSPDLWVRTSDDGGATHQAPEFGQDNFFFARVRNRGSSARHFAVAFNCKPYAGIEFVYPDDFLPCAAAVAGFDLAAGDTRIVKARWPAALVPPAGTHACLLAAAIARGDHPVAGAHVWEHNNLAQRNTTVVDLVAGDWIVIPVLLRSVRRRVLPWFDLVVVRPKGYESLRSELLVPRPDRGGDPGNPTLDCAGWGADEPLAYEPWTSRRPDAVVAGRFRNSQTKAFGEGARGAVLLKRGEPGLVGWRVTVPEEASPGSSIVAHLMQRNPLTRRVDGGVSLEIRVRGK